jgi:lipooligosaccharide transport system permease protein
MTVVDVKKTRRWAWWQVTEYRLVQISKWWTSVLLFGVGNPVLYLFSIGLGVGALVQANSGGTGVDGVPYLTFLAPALLATAAIQGAQDEATFPVVHGFVWGKNFYSINSTPTTGTDIANGVMAVAVIRTFVTTGLYAIVLVLFNATTLERVIPMYFVACIAALCYASVMLAASAFVKIDGNFFEIIQRLIIMPMFMFSGTFFPLENMPIYLQVFGWISPLWHATNLGRAISFGHEITGWLLIVHILYLGAMAVVGLKIAYRQFSKRLEQ